MTTERELIERLRDTIAEIDRHMYPSQSTGDWAMSTAWERPDIEGQLDEAAAYLAAPVAPAEHTKVSAAEMAEVDSSLGLVELTPIRVSAALAMSLRMRAAAEGVGVQAYVRQSLESAAPVAPAGIAPSDCVWARNGHQVCPSSPVAPALVPLTSGPVAHLWRSNAGAWLTLGDDADKLQDGRYDLFAYGIKP